MKTTDFIKEFEQNVVFVGENTLTIDSILNELEEWDSMATIATIALADEKLGIQLNVDKLMECKTVGDIVNLLKEKLED